MQRRCWTPGQPPPSGGTGADAVTSPRKSPGTASDHKAQQAAFPWLTAGTVFLSLHNSANKRPGSSPEGDQGWGRVLDPCHVMGPPAEAAEPSSYGPSETAAFVWRMVSFDHVLWICAYAARACALPGAGEGGPQVPNKRLRFVGAQSTAVGDRHRAVDMVGGKA